MDLKTTKTKNSLVLTEEENKKKNEERPGLSVTSRETNSGYFLERIVSMNLDKIMLLRDHAIPGKALTTFPA